MAINFPATSGQPTDGSYTHTVGNITWLWDGISWRSGVSSTVSETDPVFTSSAAGSISSTNVANWNAAYNWGDHSLAGYGSGGGGASVTTSDVAPTSPSDGDLWWQSDTGYLKIYYSDGDSDQWVDASPSGSSDGTGISLGSLSVTTAAAGTASLSYDNSNGVFSYTPPDLSGYSTFSGSYADLTNKPTLFSGSYTDLTNKPTIPSTLNDLTDVDAVTNAANGKILKYNGSSWELADDLTGGGGGGGIALTDISVTTASAGTAALSYNNVSGVFTYTPPDLSGYLTAESDTLDTVTGRGATTTNNISVGKLSLGTASGNTGADSLALGDNDETLIYYEGNSVNVLQVQSDRIHLRAKTGLGDNFVSGVLNGEVKLFYSGTPKLETTSSGITVSGTVTDNKGDLRTIPINSHTANYTLLASDAGTVVSIDGASGAVDITIPNAIFSAGQMITILNNGGQDVNIIQGTSTTVRYTDTGNSGNRTMDSYSSATILVKDSNLMYVSGTRFK